MNYAHILDDVLKIVESLKQIFVGIPSIRNDFDAKNSKIDLVTEYDQEIELLIKSQLKIKFIGEESCNKSQPLSDEPTWMVDPIDGTTNFIHNFPAFCVSIGLCFEKNPVLGVIYFPYSEQTFYAYKGSGAFLNGSPIIVSSNNLSNSLVLTNFGSSIDSHDTDKKLKVMKNLLSGESLPHGIRMTGSAAHSICMIASGMAEIYYEWGIYCWDVCASAIILTEAGGVISSSNNNSSFFDNNWFDNQRKFIFSNNLESYVQIESLIKN